MGSPYSRTDNLTKARGNLSVQKQEGNNVQVKIDYATTTGRYYSRGSWGSVFMELIWWNETEIKPLIYASKYLIMEIIMAAHDYPGTLWWRTHGIDAF